LIFDFIGKGNEAFCFPPDSLKIKMFIWFCIINIVLFK
jgi:hypothetical protein